MKATLCVLALCVAAVSATTYYTEKFDGTANPIAREIARSRRRPPIDR